MTSMVTVASFVSHGVPLIPYVLFDASGEGGVGLLEVDEGLMGC